MEARTVGAQAWVSSTLAIQKSELHPQTLRQMREYLTLYPRDSDQVAHFFYEDDDWLHVPKGMIALPGSIPAPLTINENRAMGHDLPAGTRVHAQFGAHPYPAGQPAFIEAIVNNAKRNGHGGLALAPTRSGKTLCSIEAACRLGGSTLVLVDRGVLERQWVEAIEGRVRDNRNMPVTCGIVRRESFDYGPAFPFTVATLQTIARRKLPDEFRRAFRTVILDECQSVPCSTAWGAMRRIESQYVIGLTATPERPDGLGVAIPWIIGPGIAHLERRMEADVHFLHVPWSNPERTHITRNGNVNPVPAEKVLCANDERVLRIATEAVNAIRAGRQVLILAGLRNHIRRIVAAVKSLDDKLDPGVFIGGHDDPAEMRKNPCVATYGIAAKGVDFEPPPTLLILAGPRSGHSVKQAAGRVLQPHAPCKPMILDVVDCTPPLVKQAHGRARFYRERYFSLRNAVNDGVIVA